MAVWPLCCLFTKRPVNPSSEARIWGCLQIWKHLIHSHYENKFDFLYFHSLPSGISVGRSNIKQVADKRRADIEKFLVSLFKMAPEISQSDLVYTFFHPLLRDQKNPDIRLRKVKGIFDSKYIIIIIILLFVSAIITVDDKYFFLVI